MSIASSNKFVFEKNNSYIYLKISSDNRLRVEQILEILKLYFDTKKDKRLNVLDIGCGDGTIGKKIINLGSQVYGLDISFGNLKKAHNKGLLAICTEASLDLPFKPHCFDVVFAGEIIEHLYDPENFLKQINRIIKKSGLLIISTPNLAHLPDRFKFLLGQTPTQIQATHPFLKLHIRQFTKQSLQDILIQTGFQPKSLFSTMVIFKRDKNNFNDIKISSRLLAQLFPSLGSFLISTSIKK